MATGPEFIEAIKNNAKLMKVDNCPGVPARLGYAVYGDWQDDKNERVIRYVDRESLANDIEHILTMPKAEPTTNTAVWHFGVEPPIHHFVVIPWYRLNVNVGWVFTVLMAYEKKYTLGEYIQRVGSAPTDGGYKEIWTWKDLGNMLGKILMSKSVWPRYFGDTIQRAPNKITCWKYDSISLEKAIQNVRKYNMD